MIGHPKEYVVYSLLQFSHNAPCLPPPPLHQKKLHKYCLKFLLGQLQYPGEMKNKTFAKPFFAGEGGGSPRCIMGDVQMVNG